MLPTWSKVLIGVFLFGFMAANSPESETAKTPELIPTPTTSVTQTAPVVTGSVEATSTTATVTAETKKLYLVTKVIDGDTVQVNIENKVETIRLIGIDTPESVDPRKPVQCFANEASKKAKELLTGKMVSIEEDASQGDKDKYNRLLRYVFMEDGSNFAKLMISEGYGHQYTYDKPYKYMEEFKQAEIEARNVKVGLWADDACLVNTTPTPVVTANPSVYVAPIVTVAPKQTDDTYGGYSCGTKTKCTEMSTCTEAMYYLNTCGVSRLDGDKDGTPCESLCN